ncbi:MAG: M28 family peptidase [Planctomycetota bacterium]
MRRFQLLVMSLCIGVGLARSQAQTSASPVDYAALYADTIESIYRTGLATYETHARLSELCRVAPHRLAGSAGATRAIEWAQAAMVAGGLDNVRLEPCAVTHWERGEAAELRVAEPDAAAPGGATPERFRVLALGGSIATPAAGITAELVVVSSFEELRTLRERAHGKIVLFNKPMDRTIYDPFHAYGEAAKYRGSGAVEASKAGAVAALVRSATTKLDDFPHTGATGYLDDVPMIPTAAVSTLAAERLATLAAAGKPVVLFFRQGGTRHPLANSFNVVGELRGRERPDEVVLVGGHLDCWDVGHGAHDDGAGSCHALSALCLLKKLGLRPRRTLRVVLFMNEENGLGGGRAYARDHAAELDKHVFAIESDRGGFAPRGFTTDCNPEARAVLASLAALLAGYGTQGLFKGGGGADISPMQESGVILAGFYPDPQRYFDGHHTEADTIDKVNERELELGTCAIASLIYMVADLEQPLRRNPTR